MKKCALTASNGGRYPGIDPAFFSDRSRVAVATALAIKIYQLNTKQMIAKVNIDCTDAVQLVLSKNEQEFLLVRRSGTVDRVPLEEGSSKRLDIDSQTKVKKLLQHSGNTYIALVGNPKGMYEIGKLNVSEMTAFTSLYESKIAHTESGLASVSNNAKFAAFMHPKSGKIELFDLTTMEVQQLSGANRSTATCLAVSDSGLVAVGNASGVIDVAYPGSGALRALKWHLEPVQALEFSQNDEYLLSGGSERVLVFWQLATNKQQFLPRLDGKITSIAANTGNTLYALTLNGSQMVIISALDLVSRLHVAGTKAQFTKLPPDHQVARRRRRKRRDLDMWAAADYTTPMTIQPGTRSVYLLNDEPQAQVYSLIRDDQEMVVSLAPTLDTGKVRRELDIQDPRIDILRFTTDGKFMVTVDSQSTPSGLLSSGDGGVNLKFWTFVDNKWTVVTRVAAPHGNTSGSHIVHSSSDATVACGDVEIRDMALTNDSIVTAGSDGSLRMWKLDADSQAWTLRRVMPGFAAQTRNVAVAWSPDRSVLALAHDATIYLVDPVRLKMVKQLPNIAGSSIRSLVFSRSNLVVLTRTRLVIFDLVSMAERWAIALKTPSNGGRLMTVDPLLGKIILAVNYWTPQYRVNCRLLIFDPASSPLPEESYNHPYAVGAVTLIPGTNSFCFIDQRGVLNTLSGSVEMSQPEHISQVQQSTTLVSMRAGSQQATDLDSAELESDAVTHNVDVNTMDKLFEGNASLEQLFDRVLTLVS